MRDCDLISVIIPVYNVEKYLDRCLESMERQTYSDLEIILADDGSTDRCPQLCDQWAEKDTRIKVIHKKNGGLSDARNAGLEIASGNYISFIDSDDWIEPFFFEYLLSELKKNECDAAGCRYRVCSDFGEFQQDFKKTELYDRYQAMNALIDNSIKQVVWNKLYKAELIRDLYFEKGKYHEDEFWSYQVFGRINRYCELDYTGYYYFQRSDSIMGVKYSKKRLDAVEAKCRRQTYLEKNMPDLAFKGKINLFFTCLYHGQMCLKDCDKNDTEGILDYLKNVMNTFELKREDLAGLSLKHKIWYKISRVSYIGTCRLRNWLHIGM